MADSRHTHLQADVAVIGAGIIGHGIAHEARRQGRSVVLIDPEPASGATFAAAGMLAPVSELHYQEEELLELMLESSRLWPAFVKGLSTQGGDSGYRTTPTLAVGADAADRRALADLRAVQLAAGLGIEPLTLRDARQREPLLSPQISCALDIPADHQVDPRKLAACIASGLSSHGPEDPSWVAGADAGYAVSSPARSLLWDRGRVTGVQLESGATVTARETVVANGLGAPHLSGLPDGLNLPVRPVYGDILRLRVPAHLRPLVSSTIRGMVRGVPVYIVPRDDGTVVIGATQREDGLSAPSNAVSAGGVYQLLRDAQVLVPAVAELELLEATARARPGTPDNAPLLGRVTSDTGEVAGLIVATGFFRHGVLLTPVAAKIAGDLLNGSTDPRWAPFRPDRFTNTASLPALPTPSASTPTKESA
ncbi:glycine oxidase ThiO [Paenarthrobacter aurescens]|uniref:glycine oxidase n=1 Tax=Paenarthrobacter aurescens TaxID=43663 RepID=A0A4Y3NPK2_PAEAU|nr:glycine oxidase ThiO [Paenarthrobacter aurescens]MDO6144182.1 glycine oxidase ThiO [Paenarthrobacter aurescens]MDO6148029.1 glycine oxidase ThiO [Paenarthrobacter aurescens]MDO6159273.1 glycine oxidase ThiO [Paenarthrobacter aurescens]MDO6163256.1 glycine oxidase ThiO [Paenarthrobacter aurescens]GEB20679.1 glycine/D-amino acid oxidase [Paenarthrobacter aurescens]